MQRQGEAYDREQMARDWWEWRRRTRAERGATMGSTGDTRSGWSEVAKLSSAPPNLTRFPDVFTTREDGCIGINVTCRACRVPSVLWLEHGDVELRARDAGDGVEVIPGRIVNEIPPAAMRSLHLWCCETCCAEEEAAAQRSEGTVALKRRVRESGMPAAMASQVSWASMLEEGENPDDTKRRIRAIEAARRWAEKETPERALLLHGAPGTGKTRLAATAALERLKHSPIAWVSVAVLMAQLQAAFSDDDRRLALKVLTGKGPVVLDDLDKINPTPAVLAQIFTALDKRLQAGQRAVIITTNRKPSELGDMLGDVLMSRIVEMCGTTGIMPFPGPDRRLSLTGP